MDYRCIKDFEVDGYDDDGFSTEKSIPVRAGSLWENCGPGYVIDGEVHLDDKNGNWLEISKER